MRRAFITGISGQDGSYLAELLLDQDYEVHGLVRRPVENGRVGNLDVGRCPADRLYLHSGDLLDRVRLTRLVDELEPDEIYNLGAQSHVGRSFVEPAYTAEATGVAVTTLLEAARLLARRKEVRFYQASSSEMFGDSPPPQHEGSPFHPKSPYACAKAYAYFQTVNYREAYGLFACNGILFNHESPRRGPDFVTRKITLAVARIRAGLLAKAPLGNLDACRDWGYAPDYVRAMWLMMQRPAPGDYVAATGDTHSVREFAELAFARVGLDWRQYVEFDPRQVRPADVHNLRGDASKARRELGWQPKTGFADLVNLMVDADCQAVANAKSP